MHRNGKTIFQKLFDGSSVVLYLGIAFRKILRPDDFQCCELLDVIEASQCNLALTVSLINEMEMAKKSIDDCLMSR